MSRPNSRKASLRTPLLTGLSTKEKRQEILTYFQQSFDLYTELFSLIRSEASYYSRPEPLRHPLIFYFGHTATFFINKLVLAGLISERLNPVFESQFAIGVDEMSWDDLDRTHYDWPSFDKVQAYRHMVRDRVSQLIEEMPLSLPIQQSDPAWIILMGIEHERIHLETSSVIIRMLPLEEIYPNEYWSPCTVSGPHPENTLLPVDGQVVKLGKIALDQTYGWDNEYGEDSVEVDDFRASRHLVSNGEYLQFVQAKGYQQLHYWCDEGKRWLASTKQMCPRFWLVKDDGYYQRNLLNEIPLPENWPVEVNHYEASAFCRWKGALSEKPIRLPTEAEWHILRNLITTDQPDWLSAPGNINLEHYASSCPVDLFATQGFYDIIGNVWQWTDTAIYPFHGFQVHPIYDDFSMPTFDNKHMLIKGGSWISTGNEALKSARYAFRKHFYQHAGFRYVEAAASQKKTMNSAFYESDEQISQYLEFHFGPSYFGVENFPKACIEATIALCPDLTMGRALDLGCAVGRASFELAKHFDHVTGIDFSTRFIQCATHLSAGQTIHYGIQTEGSLNEERTAKLAEDPANARTPSVEFFQGDACNLKPAWRDFDLVFAGNLIDRLYQPALFLETIGERINKNGYLVLTSPYTWLETYTEPKYWLGGYKQDGTDLTTLQGLKHHLSDRFVLQHRLDIPFIIRETSRKYQHTVAEMTIWKKR